MVANGELNKMSLMVVQGDDTYLAVGTGWAWFRLKAAAKANLHRTISIAGKAGAYRSRGVQAAIQNAYDSRNPRLMDEWNLDRNSRVRPSDPGGSNHGLGIAVDIVGTPIDAAFIALARRYGFSFPFYTRGDPRHAVHDQRTATHPIEAPVDRKQVADWLNDRKLGRQTDTGDTGRPDEDYWWLLQTWGHREGLYPTPPYRRDGKPGPRSRWLEARVWRKIRR